MRFSMKWILAAMAYVALAAAAFSRGTWVYGDALWLATFIAVGYSAVLACFARDGRQARAGGFVILATCYLLSLGFAPESVPTERLVLYVTGQPPPIAPAPAPRMATGTFNSQPSFPGGQIVAIASGGAFNPIAAALQTDPKLLVQLRAAHAVGTMLAGLVGVVLGGIAFARRNRASAEC